MGLRDGFHWKFNPDLEYMTAPERSALKELREAGAYSFFRTGKCENPECLKEDGKPLGKQREVLREKRWCSIKCFQECKCEKEGCKRERRKREDRREMDVGD